MKTNTAVTTAKKNIAAPAPVALVIVEPTTKAKAKSTTTKLSYAKRVEKNARFLAKRVANIAKIVATWQEPTLTKAAGLAVSSMEELLEELNILPDTFVTKGKAPAKGLEVGTKVDLREKIAAKYDDIIDVEDRVGMLVLAQKKGRVVCRTRNGEKIILPRGHVVVMVAAPATVEAPAAN